MDSHHTVILGIQSGKSGGKSGAEDMVVFGEKSKTSNHRFSLSKERTSDINTWSYTLKGHIVYKETVLV